MEADTDTDTRYFGGDRSGEIWDLGDVMCCVGFVYFLYLYQLSASPPLWQEEQAGISKGSIITTASKYTVLQCSVASGT